LHLSPAHFLLGEEDSAASVLLPFVVLDMLAFCFMRHEDFFFFDTHVHLDAVPFRLNLKEEVCLAKEAKVRRFVIPGVNREGWGELMNTARSVSGALAAPGLHPIAARQWDGEAAGQLRALLQDPTAIAIGEIGLDALLAAPSLKTQEQAFRGQLRLAIEMDRPVLIHCRKATAKLLAILKEEGAQRVGGIFHAFSGSLETALEGIRLGFAIGFGGTLTYPNARRIPEVLRQLPKEWIVLETDAPDLPPYPHRGETNHPVYLPLIARKAAEIRGWSEEETARITTANARRVLKLQASGA
jgi:TatD DNase family protein